MVDKSRWIGWRAWRTWLVGWLAFHVYMLLPWPIQRRCGWMLPWVGDYACWEETLVALDLKTEG